MNTGAIILRLRGFIQSERPELLRIAEIATRRSEEIWLVGGILRDAALSRKLSDVDIAVQGDVVTLAKQVAESLDGAFVPLHNDPATARVVLDGFEYDFVALRAATILEDLRARDLRINSIAAELTPGGVGEILDPTGGQSDIENSVLRSLSSDNLMSDPLRALRVFRFMSQLDFRVDPQTLGWAREAAAGLDTVAGERIFAEFVKLLGGSQSAKVLRLANEYQILPSVMAGADSGLSFSIVETFDAWPKLCEELFEDFDDFAPMIAKDRLCSDHAIMKSAALFAEMPEGITWLKSSVERWKAPKRFSLTTAKILGLQQNIAESITEINRGVDKLLVFARYTHEAGEAWLAAVAHALAAMDDKSEDQRIFFHDLILAHQKIIRVVDGGPLIVDGARLMKEFHIKPGPIVGELLRKVREQRIAGSVNSIDDSLKLCRRLLAEMPLSQK